MCKYQGRKRENSDLSFLRPAAHKGRANREAKRKNA
jgi:hypothetical protein